MSVALLLSFKLHSTLWLIVNIYVVIGLSPLADQVYDIEPIQSTTTDDDKNREDYKFTFGDYDYFGS